MTEKEFPWENELGGVRGVGKQFKIYEIGPDREV